MKPLPLLSILILTFTFSTIFCTPPIPMPQQITTQENSTKWNTIAHLIKKTAIATPAIAARTILTIAAFTLCKKFSDPTQPYFLPNGGLNKAKLTAAIIASIGLIAGGNKVIENARSHATEQAALNLDAVDHKIISPHFLSCTTQTIDLLISSLTSVITIALMTNNLFLPERENAGDNRNEEVREEEEIIDADAELQRLRGINVARRRIALSRRRRQRQNGNQENLPPGVVIRQDGEEIEYQV